MFAIVGAIVFLGGATLALTVITRMLMDYRPMIVAALRGQPLPRTCPARQRARRTHMRATRSVTAAQPGRFVSVRVAA